MMATCPFTTTAWPRISDPAETGHRSVTPGHLGLISQIDGKPLRWNAKTETVIGNPEADALLKTAEYRSPWKFG